MIIPLVFNPIFKTVIWGGEKIAAFKGIDTDLTGIGECWEISGIAENPSVVARGPLAGMTLPEVLARYGEELVGKSVYRRYGNTFPLLIKIIDTAADLSLQVHPDDELAARRHNSLGKTEMWYVVDADPGAVIHSGFSREITPQEYEERAANNTLMDVVTTHKSHPGDVFFLPAGRIHSAGAGNLLIEIHETSDITYRIYDFGRVDARTGRPRELHVEEAKEAIDYKVRQSGATRPGPETDGKSALTSCSHFTADLLRVGGEREVSTDYDSFTTLTCIEGSIQVRTGAGEETALTLRRGQSALIPAPVNRLTLTGTATLIAAHC